MKYEDLKIGVRVVVTNDRNSKEYGAENGMIGVVDEEGVWNPWIKFEHKRVAIDVEHIEIVALDTDSEIKELKERIEALESALELVQKGVAENVAWEPKGGDWLVDGLGVKEHIGVSEESKDYGVSFDNEYDAKMAFISYRAYHRLYSIALELNEGWVPDWSDEASLKYNIYKGQNGKYAVGRWDTNEYCGVYFKRREVAEKAIKLLGLNDDLLGLNNGK